MVIDDIENGRNICKKCGTSMYYGKKWHCPVCDAVDFYSIDVVCCECGVVYDKRHSLIDKPSHGYCERCFEKKMEEVHAM